MYGGLFQQMQSDTPQPYKWADNTIQAYGMLAVEVARGMPVFPLMPFPADLSPSQSARSRLTAVTLKDAASQTNSPMSDQTS